MLVKRPHLRWTLFPCYLAFFLTFPLWVLGDLPGLGIGLALTVAVLLYFRMTGIRKIKSALQIKPLNQAQAPQVFTLVNEHARRLDIAPPQMGIIESPSIHCLAFGFSRSSSWLVVTSGLLETMSRECISAVTCRAMLSLWHPDYIGETWLTSFLMSLDLDPKRKRFYPFRFFLKQVLIYPLALIPGWILKSDKSPMQLNDQAGRMLRDPQPLAEAYRLMQASRDRLKLDAPFSTYSLFLVPPPLKDGLGQVFFERTSVSEQLKKLDSLTLQPQA